LFHNVGPESLVVNEERHGNDSLSQLNVLKLSLRFGDPLAQGEDGGAELRVRLAQGLGLGPRCRNGLLKGEELYALSLTRRTEVAGRQFSGTGAQQDRRLPFEGGSGLGSDDTACEQNKDSKGCLPEHDVLLFSLGNAAARQKDYKP
jgi:hypothetical protein